MRRHVYQLKFVMVLFQLCVPQKICLDWHQKKKKSVEIDFNLLFKEACSDPISYFWKFWHFWSTKLKFWPKKWFFFLLFLVKIFKNKKLIKKWQNIPYIHVFRWLWQILVIFVQNIFLTLVKKILGQKINFFGDFSKIWFLAKNLAI